MRRFLLDYEQIVTMENVRNCYDEDCDYKEESSFEDYLREALGKNGALVEILTIGTPRNERRNAVCYCSVVDITSDEETMHDDVRWLNWYEIRRLQSYGYHVVPTDYNAEDWN